MKSNVKDAESKRPEIFGYHDYRAFLRDWFEFLKESRPGFSLRSLSRDADVANGYLPMVLSGTRNLSSKAAQKLLPHLGLNNSERSYFQSLHTLSETESPSAKIEAFDKLQKFRAYREQNPKESETYRYLTRWFYVAIREMAAMPSFKLDASWIQRQLRTAIPLNEIKQALEFLVKARYIEPAAQGKAVLPTKDVECVGGIFRIALSKFHREMLQLAALSLESTPGEERTICGHTLAIPSKKFEAVKGILDEALKKIASLDFGADEKDIVYHVVLSAFPLTQKSEVKEDEDSDNEDLTYTI